MLRQFPEGYWFSELQLWNYNSLPKKGLKIMILCPGYDMERLWTTCWSFEFAVMTKKSWMWMDPEPVSRETHYVWSPLQLVKWRPFTRLLGYICGSLRFSVRFMHLTLSQTKKKTCNSHQFHLGSVELFFKALRMICLCCGWICQVSYEKNPPTFHYTGWFIGILILAY